MDGLLRKRASSMYLKVLLNRRSTKEIKLATRLIGLDPKKLKDNYESELKRLRVLHRNDPAKLELVDHFSTVVRKTRDARQAPNNLSEEVGLAAARYEIQRMIADAGGDGVILVDGRRGNDTLDIVAVIKGRLVVVEAKGGLSKHPTLGTRLVQDDSGDWHVVRQGSRIYLRTLISKDKGLRRRLIAKGYKHILDEFEQDTGNIPVDYYLVHARIRHGAVVPGSSPRRRQPDSIQYVEMRTFNVTGGNVNTIDPPHKPRPSKVDTDKERKRVRRIPVSWVATAGGITAGLAIIQSTLGAPRAGAQTPDTPSGTESPSASTSPENRSTPDGGVLSSLKEKAAAFGRMLSSFKDHVQNGLNSLATMVGNAAAKVSAFVTDILDSTGSQALIEEASRIWAEGQELINIAMLLSPVGTVTAAISAAIAIIQQLVAHWDEIRAGFDWALKNVLEPVAEFFKAAFKVYITPYKAVFDLVMAGFNGMSGVVGGVVSTVGSVVAGIVRTIGEFLQKIDFSVAGKHFGLKSIGDAMVSWAAGRMADGGLVQAPGAARVPGDARMRRSSGIHVMAVIDQSVLRAAQAEERKIGYAYRPPLLHDGALARRDGGLGARTVEVRVPDVEAAFAEIKTLQARHDMRFESVGV
ncbi:hypothetical protein AB0N05_35285 [Nocardia sp. NPDC051030]|uniref:hypothetical protein n=1 Tax=Nocardia sp. NPDC051030 TaxID=3155162 RepID=UPI0034283D46